MNTQAKFCVWFTNIKSKPFSGEQKLPLISKVGHSHSTKKLFLWLSAWDNELLSTPKTIAFMAVPLSKLHEPALSNVIL